MRRLAGASVQGEASDTNSASARLAVVCASARELSSPGKKAGSDIPDGATSNRFGTEQQQTPGPVTSSQSLDWVVSRSCRIAGVAERILMRWLAYSIEALEPR